jgi:hypothetical protein
MNFPHFNLYASLINDRDGMVLVLAEMVVIFLWVAWQAFKFRPAIGKIVIYFGIGGFYATLAYLVVLRSFGS